MVADGIFEESSGLRIHSIFSLLLSVIWKQALHVLHRHRETFIRKEDCLRLIEAPFKAAQCCSPVQDFRAIRDMGAQLREGASGKTKQSSAFLHAMH